jgi:hypothetical protein
VLLFLDVQPWPHQRDFGELYVDGHRPDEWRHVFASIQSLAQANWRSSIPPRLTS